MRMAASLKLIVRTYGEDYSRLEGGSLVGSHLRVGHDDNLVTGLKEPGSSPVQTNLTTASLARNDVGFYTRAVHIVDYVHMFAGHQACSFHQGDIYGDAAHVVEIGLCDYGTMDF